MEAVKQLLGELNNILGLVIRKVEFMVYFSSNWGHWSGVGPSSIYSKQKYENGHSCWNGPERSTEVSSDLTLVRTFL